MKSHNPQNLIFFRNLIVQSSIGVHDEEKQNSQRVIINLELTLGPNHQTKADDLSETLDYDRIRENVLRIASSKHFNLQETLCEQIADYCLAEKPVLRVKVSSQKPDIYQDCDGVGLEIIRHKI